MSSVVPEGWITGKLKEFALLTKGLTYASSDYSDEHNGLPFLTLKSISKDGGYSPKGLKFYKGEFKEHHVLNFGDVLFANTDLTRNGDVVGSPLFFNGFGFSDQALYSMDLSKLKVDPCNTDAKFLYFLLMTHRVKRWMVNSSAGSTVLHLDTKRVREITLNLPPLPEQKKIASILTSVDEVIENTKKQIDKLQDLKKATMNELLTKGIGHTEFKDSELGRIPKSWEVLPLSKVCEVSSSKRVMQSDYVDKGVPFFRSKEIILKSKGNTVKSILYISEEQFFNLSIRFGAPESGDILITAVGTIGICYLVGDERFYFKDGNLLWLKNIVTLMPSFLSVFLSSNRTRERIIEISGGSSQSALTIEKLSDFLVPVPSRNEQEKLSKIARSLDECIDSQKQKLTQTQSLKKSLMQDLLTGRVRVNL